jgi:3-methyl-2-oxobutanoate hydroxymethyltransferase
MVVQGHETTLPVTLEDVIYHTRAVARGVERAQIVGDMPFMSYQTSLEQGLVNAGRLIKEGGAHTIKLEGGAQHAELVSRLVRAGIPVMGHIGLTPQSFHQLGGFKVQGREAGAGERLLDDAKALEQAGAYSIVLEGIPSEIAAEITRSLSIPTIGIGAGVECDGQVLVVYDLLGMNDSFKPRFVRTYEKLSTRIRTAVDAYVTDVRDAEFPAANESFVLAPAAPARRDAEVTAIAVVGGCGTGPEPRETTPPPSGGATDDAGGLYSTPKK